MKRILALLLAVLILAPVGNAWAAGSCSIFRSWITGDTLTASDQTTSFVTVGQTNMIPTCMDDYSANLSQTRSTSDPYPLGAESFATTLAGELERLRYVIQKGFGWSQWYAHNGVALTASASPYSLTANWNNAGVTFPGALTLNVTDTASAAGSLLLDIQVGAVSKLSLSKAGLLTLPATSNQIALGTTNVGTITASPSGTRTWTIPDITGTFFLANGGQTVSSGVWNGTAVGAQYGGTGINTSTTAANSILYTSATGTWTTAAASASGQYPRRGASGTVTWDYPVLLNQVFH